MRKGLLEVIAVDAEDARRAVDGGADRLELVSEMRLAGLSPSPETVRAVRAAVPDTVPVRVMLRGREGFEAGGEEGLAELTAAAHRLREAGASEFVIGWLDERGEVDMHAMEQVRLELAGAPFTFHKAMDRIRNRDLAFDQIRGIPGIDTVLTSGGPFPAGQGVAQLAVEAARESALGGRLGLKLLVGGGLRIDDVPQLRAVGLTDFHVGTAVRTGGDWSGCVDPDVVAEWRTAVDG